ncbi:MAG: tetratricopeptide repeat protein [Kiritimatiellaeota bacterium]|nr:tetratricopeptide repeat protein [Kiritimatiellota bacterium]
MNDPPNSNVLDRADAFLAPRTARVLLLCLTLLVWGRTVTFDFVWDDHSFIENLGAVRSLRNIPRMFYDINAQAVDGMFFRVFRPLRTAMYAVLFAIERSSRPQAWLYHLANIMAHAGVVLLLYEVLRLSATGTPRDETLGRRVAFLAAAGFAVHPAVSEVVCWAKCLDDLMAAAFVLAAWRALLVWPVRRGGYVWAVAFFILAVYSKVSALPFFLFVPLLLARHHRLHWRENLFRSVPFWAVSAIFLFHRYGVLGQNRQVDPLSGSYIQTVADTVATAPRYARLALGGPPFCIDYGFLKPGTGLLTVPILAGVVLVLGLVVGAVLLLRRESAGVTAGLGLAWMGLFFLPVSNLVPMMQYMAERFLYLPLLGWTVVMAAGAAFLGRRRPALMAFLYVPLILVWAATSWVRAGIWRDDLVLFVTSSRTCPPTERVVTNAIRATFQLPHMLPALKDDSDPEKVNWDAVDRTLAELRRLYPTHGEVLLAYAAVAIRRDRPASARRWLAEAARLAADDPFLWCGLARFNTEQKQWPAARANILKAMALDPGNPAVWRRLAEYYFARGQYRNARRVYRKLARMYPCNEALHKKLAAIKRAIEETSPGRE